MPTEPSVDTDTSTDTSTDTGPSVGPDTSTDALRRALLAVKDLRARLDRAERAAHEPIAIVGLGCRFPGGANSPDEYWQLLDEGGDAVGPIPPERWDHAAFYDPDPDAPGRIYTDRAAFIDRPVDRFDSRFFGIAPVEANTMDPQQRLLLEVSWEALEDAGVAPDSLVGSSTGVFVGLSTSDYANLLLTVPDDRADTHSGTGVAASVAAGRISYVLGLRGPAMAIDTACSSSLVAIAQAVGSLRSGACDLALAGGVNLMLEPRAMVLLSRFRALSPTGHCHAFGTGADGYVRGEGCGVVVLRRLSDAEAAGERILAVIRGAAFNHDGRSSGLTVPSPAAQRQVMDRALADAMLEAADIDLVEAHGTGTELGDPIEVRALAQVHRDRDPANPVLVTAAKTNIGHLEAAAGVAGLMKVVLAMRHDAIPAHLHCEELSTHVDWDAIPVRVQREARPWPRSDRPRRAGVSSFGFSGTNAHVIVEEPPPADARTSRGPAGQRPFVIPLSAQDDQALSELASRTAAFLGRGTDPADLAWTMQVGRSRFRHRAAVTARDVDAATSSLQAVESRRTAPGVSVGEAGTPPRVAMLFTGQGAQQPHMARKLFESEPIFRDVVERCDAAMRAHLEHPLRDVLYGDDSLAELVHRTQYTQPAMFAIQCGLVAIWRSRGLEPVAVAGHSIGEYAAAVTAGVLELDEAAELIAIRGSLMGALPDGGSMMAVFADRSAVGPLVEPHSDVVAVAALNGAANTVVSGERGALESIAEKLRSDGLECRWLEVSHAFHSPLMRPIVDDFARAVGGVTLTEASLPFASALVGRIDAGAPAQHDYWVDHVVEPVRFEDALAALGSLDVTHYLEIGPNPTLLGIAGRSGVATDRLVPSLRRDRDDAVQMAETVGALWVAGFEPDWRAVTGPEARTTSAPTYPFQGQRHWLRGVGTLEPSSAPTVDPVERVLYGISWRTVHGSTEVRAGGGDGVWAVIGEREGDAGRIADTLSDRGVDVVEVTWGAIAGLDAPTSGFAGVVVVPDRADPSASDAGRTALTQLRDVAERARSGTWLADGAHLHVVVRNAEATAAAEPVSPDAATLVGMAVAVGTEIPYLGLRTIDIGRDLPDDDSGGALLAAALLVEPDETRLAVRDGRLLAARLVRRERAPGEPPPPDPDGAYVITGGLGALGLHAADVLARNGVHRIVLVSRRAPSEEAEEKIEAVRRLGADVTVMSADVADPAQVDELLGAIRSTIGPLHGIIHAAGVLADAPVEQLDDEHLEIALRPKYDGAWNLHRATADDPLRCFVLYSSAAGVIGSVGQANYAAANAGLDALAHLRRERGLPAVSLDWGGWAEIGMASRLPPAHIARLRAAGSKLLDPALAGSVLEYALRSGETQLVVVDIDWDKAAASSTRSTRFIDVLLDETGPPVPPPARQTPGAALDGLGDDEVPGAVRELVRAEVAGVLGVETADQLGDDDDVTALGIDSLMAVELANRLAAVLGVEVPPTTPLEHPVVGHLADHLATLVAASRGEGSDRVGTLPAPVALAARDLPVVCSSAQQRILFLDQFSPGMTVFNLPMAFRLRGVLDVGHFRDALLDLVRRHESLRTGFELIDGVWHQLVMGADEVELPWSADTVPDEDAALDRAQVEVARPFDLIHDVKLRATLLTVEPETRVLVLTLHHIAADAWSIRILMRELVELYLARIESRDPELATLGVQFLDYAAWRADPDLVAEEERSLGYWVENLAGSLPVLDLPGDRSRPAVNSFAAGSMRVEFGDDLVQAMHRAARDAEVTPFMFLLASYVATLARWSGQDDFVVGTAAANRSRPEFEPVVGMFVNTLPLRLRFDVEAAFSDLLAEAKRAALGAFAHQDALFDRIVEAVNPPRDVSRATLFQTMLVLNNVMGLEDSEVPGLDVEAMPLRVSAVEHDLSVTIVERTEGASVGVDFKADVFDPDTIERFLDHWQRLLRAAADDPSRAVAELPLLSADERAVLTGPWAQGPVVDVEPGIRLDELVATRAAERPDSVAVVAGGEQTTYSELMAMAHRIAGALAEAGVTTGDRVGVGVERSATMVAVLLAILESGAAYVPLDPNFPPERLDFMIDDAGLEVVVTSGGSLGGVDLSKVTEIDVEAERARLDGFEAVPPLVERSGDPGGGVAYVIYTSGSTGRPKGVAIEHRSVVSFVRSMSDEPGCAADDVMLAVTTLSFDISVLELFVPLAAGATVVIASRDDAIDGRELAALIETSGATLMQATPSTWTMLFESGWTGAPTLTVLCGGEAMPVDLGSRLLASCRAVWNMFGPTETTIWSTLHRVTEDSLENVNVPIGRPIANTVCRIVDPAGELVPIGVPGELMIGGMGVARGYLGRPELTAERFVIDPVAGEGRSYRTGDLARWLPGGDIEFLGRMDLQVKVRGFRVELGEIETALRNLPAVADAVVIADGPPGQARLLAYLVPAGDQLPEPAELRAELQQHLPDYMVPARFVRLDAFPLTPNRKVDRKALPAPDPIDTGTGHGEAARDALEHLLVELWQDVLGRAPIGIHDNFFDLGGYSLLGTRLFALIEQATGERVPVAALFQSPTIAELAETIRSSGWSTEWSSLVPISPGGSRTPLFYVGSYLISILQLAHLGEELGADQPLYGLQPRGLDGSEPPDERIEDMAAHYISEMRSVQPHGPYIVGGHCAGSWVAFEIARQLEDAGDEVAGVIIVDLGPPGEMPEISPLRYIWHRLKLFYDDGRLRHAIAWQAKILLNRILLRRVGGEEVRTTGEVQAAHHRAHSVYEGGDVGCDLVLVRTEETMALDDRSWFLRWDRVTSGVLHVADPVVGIHSDLLEQPNVKALAATFRHAVDTLEAREARAGTGAR